MARTLFLKLTQILAFVLLCVPVVAPLNVNDMSFPVFELLERSGGMSCRLWATIVRTSTDRCQVYTNLRHEPEHLRRDIVALYNDCSGKYGLEL
jgi:hypothetical protein